MCVPRLVLAAWMLLGVSMAWADAPRPLPKQRFLVVIDPGHGGRNGGCRTPDGRVREKTVTLAIAKELRAELERWLPHSEIVLTRGDDQTLPLGERTAVANGRDADLLISIHANASPQRDQHGFETYVLRDDVFELDAARLVRRAANSGDVWVNGLLGELDLHARRLQALHAAELIQREQAERFPNRLDRGVKQAAFDVLVGVKSPAVLVEVGFLDHPDESRLLMESRSRSAISRGLAASVLDYYRHAARQGWLRPLHDSGDGPS